MPPRAVVHDDSSASPKAKQGEALTDFRARKQMLTSGGKKQKQKQKQKKKDIVSTNDSKEVANTSAPISTDGGSSALTPAADTNNVLSGAGAGYGGMMNAGGYGMGMGGMGMGGYGMYGGMGMGGYGMMGPGPLSSLNQFLFGVQATIFSLGQAVQVLGMNTHAMHQLLESASSMLDHALATWHEMRALEAASQEGESEEQKKRRRRLKALRWALVVASTYAAYRLLRSTFSARKRSRRRRLASEPTAPGYGHHQSALTSPYSQYGGYNSMSPYGTSFGSGMYGGAPYGGAFY